MQNNLAIQILLCYMGSMFIRIAKQKRGDKVYRHLQIAESFRDPAKGKEPRTRIIAQLGTIEGLGEEQIAKLIAGLQRAIGKEPSAPTDLLFARDFGDVHAVGGVWDLLGLSAALDQCRIAGRSSAAVSELVRMLVMNRICDPCSKLALLDWLESVEYDGQVPSYHQLLRAMDRLIRIKDAAEVKIAKRLLSEVEEMDLVFYDITSTYFEGERSLVKDDFRFDRRQVVIGMVMTRSGIPLCHHVFAGNTVDKTTVTDVVRDLKQRFNLNRIIFVGDRGMLSDANLGVIMGEELGFIVAHPLRKNTHATDVIGKIKKGFNTEGDEEQFQEDVREAVRFVVAYHSH